MHWIYCIDDLRGGSCPKIYKNAGFLVGRWLLLLAFRIRLTENAGLNSILALLARTMAVCLITCYRDDGSQSRTPSLSTQIRPFRRDRDCWGRYSFFGKTNGLFSPSSVPIFSPKWYLRFMAQHINNMLSLYSWLVCDRNTGIDEIVGILSEPET